MAQHKMKKKVSLPAGAKVKSGKVKKEYPKKRGLMAAPKKPHAVADMKMASIVTRTVNQRNEETVKYRADKEQGRLDTKTKNVDKKKKN
uniref:Leydig cell tumor 10 kDa protein homolog n=1 Tax=Parastrongyloides trichosuri TaxID=131310 RepID=A0A0N4Z591_PARTI